MKEFRISKPKPKEIELWRKFSKKLKSYERISNFQTQAQGNRVMEDFFSKKLKNYERISNFQTQAQGNRVMEEFLKEII